MPGITQTLLRKANIKEGDPLNILTFSTHERYQTNLAKTGHNFFLWGGEHVKKWAERYAPLPSNHFLLNAKKGDAQLPLYTTIDLVLSQNKFGQFKIALPISQQLQCPLISLEHTLPHDGCSAEMLEGLKNQKGHINLFISEYSREKWRWREDEGDVIHHGIDTEVFMDHNGERKPVVCSVVNDWENRNWACGFKIWQQVTGHPNPIFPLNVWGDTPNLSESTYGVPHLVEQLNNSLIYLNTSLISPIPTALLEGMSCGCIPISTSTCMIPEIIEHGVDGFLSNDPAELRGFVQMVLDNPEKYKEVGKRAREKVQKMFGLDTFVENWNKVFYGTVE